MTLGLRYVMAHSLSGLMYFEWLVMWSSKNGIGRLVNFNEGQFTNPSNNSFCHYCVLPSRRWQAVNAKKTRFVWCKAYLWRCVQWDPCCAACGAVCLALRDIVVTAIACCILSN